VRRSASLGVLASTSISPKLIWDLMQIRERYDVIHVHLPNPMANLALWLARPKAKIVVHWHSDIVKQKTLLKLYEPLQNWLLRRADKIIATSAPYLDASPWLAKWRKKTEIVPIGIRADHLHVNSETLALLQARYKGKRVVFSLGGLTYYKGFQFLIEAARKLPEDVIVLIGGNGELRPELDRAIAIHGLAGKVEMLGRVSDEDLPAYYALADVFCLPSIARSEAYGVVLLEAMAMGKPIVATEIPCSGVPWVNQDGVTGYNATPMDAESLAGKIMAILDFPDVAQKFSLASRSRFQNQFNDDAMTNAVVTIYK